MTVRGGAKLKGARALPGRIGADGAVATSSHDIAGVVLRYFADIEAAEVCSAEALADRHANAPPAHPLGCVRGIDNV